MNKTCLFLAGLLLLVINAAQAQFDFITNANVIEILHYTGPGGSVVVPSTTNGLPVTTISDYAFSEIYTITNILFPSSITNIGIDAFSYCDALTAINVDPANPAYSSPGGVLHDASRQTLVRFPEARGGSYTISNSVATVQSDAFAECESLMNLTFGTGVTNIGSDALFGCSALAAFNVAAGNLAFSGSGGVLFDHTGTILLQYPAAKPGPYTIPNNVISVAADAFIDCGGVTSVIVPDNVAVLGSQAFWASYAITNIMIGAGVTNIGDDSFYACTSLKAINVSAQNLFYSSTNGVLFDKAMATLIALPESFNGVYAIPPGVVNIAPEAFAGGRLAGVTIPAGVTNIGEEAFYDCPGLTNLVLPNTVTAIGYDTFGACQNLSSVTLSDHLGTIYSVAFDNEASLTNLTIPAGVTNIQNSAFASCPNLTGVFFSGDVPAIDPSAFGGDSQVTLYYLPGRLGWSPVVSGLTAVLWNPMFQTTGPDFGVKNGRFGFDIVGTSGIPIVLEAASNLTTAPWFPLLNGTLTNGSVIFSDPGTTNFSKQFYRVSSP